MDEIQYTLRVNAVPRTVRTEPRKLLLDVLREEVGLTGPHAGCEHGVCGACTVLLDGKSVRSCLMFGVQAAGHEVRTIESLATGDRLHPLQQAFSDSYALQCGFCTPGMIMTALELLNDVPDPTPDQVRETLSGNLCRCTGYGPIVDAVIAAGKRMREGSTTA
ncbi:MAG: (2Fe-2S)-binding protein [Chloroflexi bacterium]|nr:(2Fe-2S)-binding protein [Chloroflexota bacterium]